MEVSETAQIVFDFLKTNASESFARKDLLEDLSLTESQWANAQKEVAAMDGVTKTGNKRSTRYQYTG